MENITFKTIEDLKKAGFQGFVPVATLNRQGVTSVIPARPGVYMVVRTSTEKPKFLTEGTGGHFKHKDPNVGINELEANWVEGTCVVYIGKASSLAKRLEQYLRFGEGKPVGHWGGRYIWQLADAKELLFCWLPLPSTMDPEEIEHELISTFRAQYWDCRPFANLRD